MPFQLMVCTLSRYTVARYHGARYHGRLHTTSTSEYWIPSDIATKTSFPIHNQTVSYFSFELWLYFIINIKYASSEWKWRWNSSIQYKSIDTSEKTPCDCVHDNASQHQRATMLFNSNNRHYFFCFVFVGLILSELKNFLLACWSHRLSSSSSNSTCAGSRRLNIEHWNWISIWLLSGMIVDPHF